LEWGTLLARILWDISVCLTFDPKRQWRVSRELAGREGSRWCDLVAYLARRPVGWVLAVERSLRGPWHAHALLVGAGKFPWKVAADVWRVRNGIATIKPVSEVTGIALYTSKSVARDGEVYLSDTLTRYMPPAPSSIVVPFVPPTDGEAPR
jgi:hypothetical protein